MRGMDITGVEDKGAQHLQNRIMSGTQGTDVPPAGKAHFRADVPVEPQTIPLRQGRIKDDPSQPDAPEGADFVEGERCGGRGNRLGSGRKDITYRLSLQVLHHLHGFRGDRKGRR
jgi:hypothetical protein